MRAVDPPVLLRGDEVVLSPPLEVDKYMKYLTEHREDYRRFFGKAGGAAELEQAGRLIRGGRA